MPGTRGSTVRGRVRVCVRVRGSSPYLVLEAALRELLVVDVAVTVLVPLREDLVRGRPRGKGEGEG